jgi:tetratricopeptide (TPR) repeat protein
VIWFGAIDGWENSPFLFCDTGDGWRFDIVWQRRLVVMAESPKWQVMQGPFPYIGLMDKAWHSSGKDLPLRAGDLYRCAQDTEIAARMAELKKVLAGNPNNTQATMELMRLNVITDQRPQLVRPLIRRAKQLAPASAEPYKYSAMYNVNSVFQYRTALDEMDRYIERRPVDPFGYDMKGFMLYRLGKYKDSIDALERAVELDPDDGYAYILMARDYAMLARKATLLTRGHYRDRALAMQQKAIEVKSPDLRRLAWLQRWLRRMLPKTTDDT